MVLRFGVVVAGLGAVAALTVLGPSACLPDLVVASEAGPAPYCGDGFIDPDAGEQCDPGPPSSDGGASSACQDCRVVCSVGAQATIFDPTTNHCYYEPGPTSQEANAVNVCEGADGHVVRFVSEKELSLVSNWAALAPFWVGLFSKANPPGWFPNEPTVEPGWFGDCPGCFAGGGVLQKVDAGVALTRCVTAGNPSDDAGSTWSESLCAPTATVTNLSRWTVCEREPAGIRTRVCGSNLCLTVAATQSAKRYVIVTTSAGANDAAIACANQGGKLVIFGSAEEREQVGYEIGQSERRYGLAVDTGLWIGLSNPTGNGPGGWAWDVPDAGMSALPWGVGQPGASGSRAYVLVQPQQGLLDSELARAGNASDAGGETHFPLCEVP